MSRRPADFEVLRFEAAPATGGVAVVELEGAFAGGVGPSRPRLLVERGGRQLEVPALALRRDPWWASFAVPLEALDDDTSEWALVPGRGPLLALPDPEVAGGDEDRYVRMARAANELRHRLGDAAAAAAAAERRLAEAVAARDDLREQLRGTRAQLEAAIDRAQAAEASAEALRLQRDSAAATAAEAHEALRRARDETRETAERLAGAEAAAERVADERAAEHERVQAAERAAAAARELEERAIAAEDDARAARRELRDVRARVEALQRERRTAAPGAAPALAGDEPAAHDDEPTAVLPDDRAAARPEANRAGEQAGEEDAEPTLERPVEPRVTRGPRARRTQGPRRAAAADVAARSVRTVRVWDDPAAAAGDPDESDPGGEVRVARRTPRPVPAGEDEVLDPAAVGARYIEPSETKAPVFTPARILAGAALVLLVLALAVILLAAVL